MRADAGDPSRRAAQATLVEVLDIVLRLMHPLMPFISEALWQRLPARTGVEREASLVIARWPEWRADRADDAAEQSMDALFETITAIRSIRGEYSVPPGAEIAVHIGNRSAPLQRALVSEERAVKRMAKVGTLTGGADKLPDGRQGAHAVLRGGSELFIALADLIDVDKERARLENELTRVQNQLQSTEAKLANEQFVSRAPAKVIDNERNKADSLRDQAARLTEKLATLQ
jgi:valyl-tRNA synthetase